MLVLTREPGQSILLGENGEIKIKVLTGGGGIRLGIEAPRSLCIRREEVHERMQRRGRPSTFLRKMIQGTS